MVRTFDEAGIDPGAGGSLEIGDGGIAKVQHFRGMEVEGGEGGLEDRGVRLPGTGIGGGDHGIEMESMPGENAVQAAVEIRDHGEFQAGGAGFRQYLRDLREDEPRRGIGIVGEEILEA